MNSKTFAPFAIAAIALLGLTPVQAQSSKTVMRACINKHSGRVVVRTKCLKCESTLSLKSLTTEAAKVEPGPVGPQGVQGLRGETGPEGRQGPQGVKGDLGPKGDTGPQGERGAEGPAGAQGIQGLTGAVGPVGLQGAQGPRGLSGFSEIPQGTTIRGVIGAEYFSSTTNTTWSVAASLHGVAPTNYGNELVVIRNNSVVDNECDGATCLHNEDYTYSSYCPGSAENPTAAPGWVCIYPVSSTNAFSQRGMALPEGNGRYGFYVRWTAKNSGATGFRAVWAYTAP